MNAEEKKKLKESMEAKRSELFKMISDLKEETKPQGLDSAVGRVSRMDYINNKSVNESSLRKAENDLKAIERWLSIYDTNRFAKCSMCGNKINMNRLLFLPSSTRCLSCADK